MTHENIVNAIVALRPGAQWILRGDELSDLEWLDQDQSRPTDEEIASKSEELAQPSAE